MAISCSSKNWQQAPKIYVANEGDGTISVIDSSSLKVIKTIKLEGMPHNVNVDPLGRYAYATNHEDEEDDGHSMPEHYLRVIDSETDRLVKSVQMLERAAHVVPSRDGKLVYVSREGGNSIVEVDVEKGMILRTFAVGEGPHGFVLSNDGRTIYAPNMRTHDVSIVDVASSDEKRMNLTFEGNKCDTPVAMGITNDDAFSFVTCGKSFDIYKISNKGLKIVGRVGFDKNGEVGPIQVPVYHGSRFIYVPDMGNGVVHKIGIEKFELVKDIVTGAGAHGIAYSSDGKKAYVTDTWDNKLSILDLESDEVINRIEVGSKPNGVAVSNGKNQGW